MGQGDQAQRAPRLAGGARHEGGAAADSSRHVDHLTHSRQTACTYTQGHLCRVKSEYGGFCMSSCVVRQLHNSG